MCGILATSTTRIMVNGDAGATIYNCKGLWQGDPVSPMLFILTMEPLHRLFDCPAWVLAAVGGIRDEEEDLNFCG